MPFHMELWKVEGNRLQQIKKSRLDKEDRLRDWITADVSILGLDLLIIGKEVTTFSGRLDLLAMDVEGNLVVLELKRDRTHRDVVAQILDYASWVKTLTKQQIFTIAERYLNPSCYFNIWSMLRLMTKSLTFNSKPFALVA
jgi:RecB family endonuclease NucS